VECVDGWCAPLRRQKAQGGRLQARRPRLQTQTPASRARGRVPAVGRADAARASSPPVPRALSAAGPCSLSSPCLPSFPRRDTSARSHEPWYQPVAPRPWPAQRAPAPGLPGRWSALTQHTLRTYPWAEPLDTAALKGGSASCLPHCLSFFWCPPLLRLDTRTGSNLSSRAPRTSSRYLPDVGVDSDGDAVVRCGFCLHLCVLQCAEVRPDGTGGRPCMPCDAPATLLISYIAVAKRRRKAA